jgi:hypothetical protein
MMRLHNSTTGRDETSGPARAKPAFLPSGVTGSRPAARRRQSMHDRRIHPRIAVVLAAVAFFAATLVVAAAPASAGVTDLVFSSGESLNNNGDYKGATASCTGGRKVIGTGVSVSSDEVVVEGLVPFEDRVEAYARADEGGAPGNWRLKVMAVCADEPAGLEIVSDDTGRTSSSKGEDADCPTDKVVTGSGWYMGYDYGEVAVTQVNIRTQSVYVYAAEDGTGSSENWNLVPYAICADPIADLEIVPSTRYQNWLSEPEKNEQAVCPGSKKVIGGGARINGAAQHAMINTIKPFSYSSGGVTGELLSVRGAEYVNGTGAAWTIDVEAICVNG